MDLTIKPRTTRSNSNALMFTEHFDIIQQQRLAEAMFLDKTNPYKLE